jgi:CHAD domain-containing protein
MQGIQDALGEIQDSQIFLKSLNSYFKKSNTIYNYRINKVIKNLIAKQKQIVIDFCNDKEALLSLNY